MFQMNFVSDTRKAAHTNDVTRKYVIMIRNKYIYEFERQYFTLHFLQCNYMWGC